MSAARANMKKTLTAIVELSASLCLGSLSIAFAQLENKNRLCFRRNTKRDTSPKQQIDDLAVNSALALPGRYLGSPFRVAVPAPVRVLPGCPPSHR
ncbi:hypothetical protein [Mycolicibacterium sp.]|uniref:hypothetical protein n=1 Tax=Mycolicibacterium sp. TaxID=2320850 RepID=UPI001D4E3616|nr:hypothetical protein [Mycolicibacterium sp.]MCB1291243.1 hypothetical protein [Mycobacterium sp.]MCB9407888.1 hypothetical protein [Mycolicibacterium sp.]